MAYNQGSIVHLETSGVMLLDLRSPLKLARELKPRKHMLEEMGAAYMAEGLVTLAGSRMYTSMADTDEVIDDALARFDAVLSGIEGAGRDRRRRSPWPSTSAPRAVKVALVDEAGRVLGWESAPLGCWSRPDGGAEQVAGRVVERASWPPRQRLLAAGPGPARGRPGRLLLHPG